MDTISKKCSNDMFYAYHKGRFWRWDEPRGIWKESHLMAQKFERARAAVKTLTPETFLTSAEFEQLDEYELNTAMLDALRVAKPCKTAPIEPVEDDISCATVLNAGVAATTAENAAQSATAATLTTSENAADASASLHETFPSCSSSAPSAPADSTSAIQSAPPSQTSASCAAQTALPTAPSFDFGADDQTNALLLQDAQTFITGNMARIMAAKHAHDLTANHYKGSWGKWCTAVGISRDTGDNMVRVAEQFGNIQLEGKSILDVQPMKLLYAAAKPSTPEEVKQAVFTGDITTYKEYQDLMAQLKAKDKALAAEKERADAAEAREEEAWSLRESAAQKYNAALADVNNLAAANQQKNKELEAVKKDLRDARDAIKQQPIATVVDEEEVDRRAAEKAWDLAAARNAEIQADKERLAKDNAALQKQLAEARSTPSVDPQEDIETVDTCYINIEGIWNMARPAFTRLIGTGEDLNKRAESITQLCDRIRAEAIQFIIQNDKETQYE